MFLLTLCAAFGGDGTPEQYASERMVHISKDVQVSGSTSMPLATGGAVLLNSYSGAVRLDWVVQGDGEPLPIEDFARRIGDPELAGRIHRQRAVDGVGAWTMLGLGASTTLFSIWALTQPPERDLSTAGFVALGAGFTLDLLAIPAVLGHASGRYRLSRRWFDSADINEGIRGYNAELCAQLGLDAARCEDADDAPPDGYDDTQHGLVR